MESIHRLQRRLPLPSAPTGSHPAKAQHELAFAGRNPLELPSAIIFAITFSLMGMLTMIVRRYLDIGWFYGLSFVSGLSDVDPFVMSLGQSADSVLEVHSAAKGVVIATASNNDENLD